MATEIKEWLRHGFVDCLYPTAFYSLDSVECWGCDNWLCMTTRLRTCTIQVFGRRSFDLVHGCESWLRSKEARSALHNFLHGSGAGRLNNSSLHESENRSPCSQAEFAYKSGGRLRHHPAGPSGLRAHRKLAVQVQLGILDLGFGSSNSFLYPCLLRHGGRMFGRRATRYTGFESSAVGFGSDCGRAEATGSSSGYIATSSRYYSAGCRCDAAGYRDCCFGGGSASAVGHGSKAAREPGSDAESGTSSWYIASTGSADAIRNADTGTGGSDRAASGSPRQDGQSHFIGEGGARHSAESSGFGPRPYPTSGVTVNPAIAHAIQQGGVDSKVLAKPSIYDPVKMSG